jgi:hypothetical protein
MKNIVSVVFAGFITVLAGCSTGGRALQPEELRMVPVPVSTQNVIPGTIVEVVEPAISDKPILIDLKTGELKRLEGLRGNGLVVILVASIFTEKDHKFLGSSVLNIVPIRYADRAMFGKEKTGVAYPTLFWKIDRIGGVETAHH